MGKNVLKITCMDRKLGHAIDEQNESSRGTVTMIRNAGANLRGIEDSVRHVVESKRIDEIDVLPHTDCGACNVVYNVINHKINVSSEVDKTLVRQFTDTGMTFATPADVEKENTVLQEDALQRFRIRGIETHVNCIDLEKLEIPKEHGESVLVIGKPYSGKYEDLASKLDVNLWSMYCLNAESIIEIMADIEVAAINLKIKNFKLVAVKPSEYRWAREEMERLKMHMPFMRDIKAEVVEL